MKRNGTVLTVIVALVALMIYAGARLSRRSGSGKAPQENSRLKGSTAPDFELKALDGKTVKLSSYRGKAVLLNFWATWCGPCKVETPWLVDLYKQYHTQGLEILGIAMDDSGSRDEIPKFVKQMDVNYPILEGTEKVGDDYEEEVLPMTFFIDRNGKIVDVVIGLKDRSDLEDNIKNALAIPPQTVSATNSTSSTAAK